MDRARIAALANRLIEAYDRAHTLDPITASDPSFDVAAGYAVLHEIEARRVASGWRPVGRKIGFTNRTIWARYGVDRPMWAHIYAHTVHHAPGGQTSLALSGLVQPRIEPEVVFGLRGPVPTAGDASRCTSNLMANRFWPCSSTVSTAASTSSTSRRRPSPHSASSPS